MEKEIGSIEKFTNELSRLVTLHEKENVVLKAKGQFGMQQANNTMTRLAQDIGSYVIKNIIKADLSSNTSCGVKE